MGRLALRPALRNSVHAPGAVETAAAWAASTECVSHDGVDDYTYGEVPRSIIEAPYSVSFWFKLPSGMSDSYIYAITQGLNGVSHGGRYNLTIRHYALGNLRTYSSGEGGSSSVSVYTDFRDDAWHHYVYTTSQGASSNGIGTINIDLSLIHI